MAAACPCPVVITKQLLGEIFKLINRLKSIEASLRLWKFPQGKKNKIRNKDLRDESQENQAEAADDRVRSSFNPITHLFYIFCFASLKSTTLTAMIRPQVLDSDLELTP